MKLNPLFFRETVIKQILQFLLMIPALLGQ